MDISLLEHHSRRLRSRKKLYGDSINNYIREEGFNNRYSVRDRKESYDALGDPYTSYYFSNRSVRDHLKKFKRAIREEPNLSEQKKLNHLLTMRLKQKFKDFVCPRTQVYEKEMSSLELDMLGKRSSETLTKKKSKQTLVSTSSKGDHKEGNHQQKVNQLKFQHHSQQASLPPPHNEPQSVNEQSQVQHVKPTQNIPRVMPLTSKAREQATITHMLPQTERSVELPSRLKTSNRDSLQQKMFADKLAQELHTKKHDKWLKFLEEKKQLLKRGNDQSGLPEN